MKPLTTSVYTFSQLRDHGFLYVDKTAKIYELVEPGIGQYFLARPRRFGKSLLISTLKSIFLGQRELFDGLAIGDTDYDWQTYPVLHLNLGTAVGADVEETKTALMEVISEQAQENGIELSHALLASRFRELIQKMADNGPVVILIDEYDKPLLAHVGEEAATGVHKLLKLFYSAIKDTAPYQRFVLLTGVSKFSRVSVFSDLNNLTDLTMSRSAATLLGYTHDELVANFPDYIERLAEAQNASVEETLQNLREWYNGYRFHQDGEPVYNPVSVMKCLQEQEFQNFWFETGNPTFLLDALKRRPVDMDELTVPEIAFSTYEPDNLHPLPLLLQTGYLTIKDARRIGRRREYTLDYPNYEIEESFSAWIAQGFSNLSQQELNSALHKMVGALRQSRVDDMLEHLKVFFSGVPNTITLDHEKYYQTIFFTVFKLIGTIIEAETSTNIGRIDAIIKTESDIFIFEFKLHDTAQDALEQILQKEYAAPYRDDPRPITLVGAAFDPETRNLAEWRTESAQ